MKILTLGALVAVAMTALVGCGEDTVAPTDINTHFEPKKGDTFTYARYDRDTANMRIEATKTIHKWAVIETGIAHKSATGVAKILQLNYDISGTTKLGEEIIYLRSGIDGKVYMNVVQDLITRIPFTTAYASAIPFEWFQIGDVKSSTAITYPSLTGSGITIDTLYDAGPIVGKIDLRLNVTASAQHVGKVATSIGSVLYPETFRTGHTVRLRATLPTQSNLVIVDDTLKLSYDIDVKSGILRQSRDTDIITANIPVLGVQKFPVPGFEMELIGVVRAN